MSRARFFVSGVQHRDDVVSIEGGDAHHITDVLRLRPGDHIEVIDSSARTFVAELERDGRRLRARLVEELAGAPVSELRIDVAQALPKGSKMDIVVEKATELGAAAIVPFCSERAIARVAGTSKLARWRRIARSAAEQCGRADIPTLFAPMQFEELLARFEAYDLVLFAWESEERRPLRERLPALLAGAHRVLVVIGPEGGFSHAESDAARAHGARVVSLGERVLRTETAALVLLAILNYEIAEGRNAEVERRITSG